MTLLCALTIRRPCVALSHTQRLSRDRLLHIVSSGPNTLLCLFYQVTTQVTGTARTCTGGSSAHQSTPCTRTPGTSRWIGDCSTNTLARTPFCEKRLFTAAWWVECHFTFVRDFHKNAQKNFGATAAQLFGILSTYTFVGVNIRFAINIQCALGPEVTRAPLVAPTPHQPTLYDN